MSNVTRRKLITTGLATAAGAAGLAAAARIADRYGLIPPEGARLYHPGETLTYASHRLLARQSAAREFARGQISKDPFPNHAPPDGDDYARLRAGGFAGWRIEVDGMVANPTSFSLADLRSFPSRSQITMLQCEEGWSFIAEWIGTPLSEILAAVGTLPQARYVDYYSIQPKWRQSIDMADALHPQTFLTYGMNGGELPEGHGAPVRLSLPRQLSYKSVKYITRLTLTDRITGYGGKGRYSWYAGI
ncbi:MAG: molybdopterin-dependent oxidoreductase [Bryobacteraceae bacterium]|nr:molybdopterin-dependent oxidoreductase [Bryobacteraceae bacterium]